MKKFIRKILGKLVLFALGDYADGVIAIKENQKCVMETTEELKKITDRLCSQSESQTQTLQYLTETLTDKSYWLDMVRQDTNVLKEVQEQLKVQSESQTQTLQYLTETLMDKSYWLDVLRSDVETQKISLRKMEIRLHENLYRKEVSNASVYQIVPVFKKGDAIGNHALFIDQVLRENHVPTQIYCEKNLSDRTDVKKIDELGATTEKDIILLHMAAENRFANLLDAYSARKVMVYHNITPDRFFRGMDEMAEKSTKMGRQQVKALQNVVDSCLADSQYNKQELEEMGYSVPIHVVPIPFSKETYAGAESLKVKEHICDGRKNLIFVGRVVPNKKFEDLITSYQYYRDHYDENCRLILVGSYSKQDRYYQSLQKMLRPQDDIIFTGHISTEEWITYYRYAHLFLCMSEHEGFCVPVIEAMSHQIPIVAFASSAVGETLGDGGVLIKDKSPDTVAQEIHTVLSDEAFAQELRRRQLKNMERFSPERVSKQLINIIKLIMEERE